MKDDVRTAEREPIGSQLEATEVSPGRDVGSLVAALLPLSVLVGGFGLLAITKWPALRSAATSGQALLAIGGITVIWIGIGMALRRFVPSRWARSGISSVLALGLVALLVVPYFRNEKVVERFPGAASARVGRPSPTTDAPAEARRAREETLAASSDPAAPAPDASVPRSDASPLIPADPAPSPAPTPNPAPTPAPATRPAPAPVAPAEPVRISSGALSGLGHRASGTAALYRQPDGSFVVGLENIDIQSGPDYFVWVVPGAGREDPDGGTNLGGLRGNQGTQFYAVPAGVDPTGWTVLVWCRAFAVPVAHATPA